MTWIQAHNEALKRLGYTPKQIATHNEAASLDFPLKKEIFEQILTAGTEEVFIADTIKLYKTINANRPFFSGYLKQQLRDNRTQN
jgi:hypothetical protein